MPEPHPIGTKVIDGRITEAQCSACHERLDLGNDVLSAKQQDAKMDAAFREHLKAKHRED